MIQINPNFLKVGSSKKSTRNKKIYKKDLRTSIKPNDIKKKLMSRIKDHQHQSKKENDEEKTELTEKFTKDFNNQINYLEKIITEKKKKKERRRTKNHVATVKYDGNKVNSATPSVPNLVSSSNLVSPVVAPVIASTIMPPQKTPTFPNINKQPKYSCLKGGTKPTFSEYRKTLKNRDKVLAEDKIILKPMSEALPEAMSESVSKPNNTAIERRNKLQLLKEKIALPKSTVPIKHFLKKKKTVKIYHLGKSKKSFSVGVLIKSGKTRKLVKDEQNILRTRCLSEVKQYLRKHNLIKAGTTAPEDVLRKLYEDSFLAGNIFNKNPENLLHNYLSKELDN